MNMSERFLVLLLAGGVGAAQASSRRDAKHAG